MFEIENKTIKISRGDSGNIGFLISLSDTENYTFNIGDKIQFRIFEKKRIWQKNNNRKRSRSLWKMWKGKYTIIRRRHSSNRKFK